MAEMESKGIGHDFGESVPVGWRKTIVADIHQPHPSSSAILLTVSA